MIASTILSLLIVPVIYVVVEYLREKLGFSSVKEQDTTPTETPAS